MVLVATAANAAGYWTAEHSRDLSGRDSCFAYTRMTNGAVLGLGINAEDQEGTFPEVKN